MKTRSEIIMELADLQERVRVLEAYVHLRILSNGTTPPTGNTYWPQPSSPGWYTPSGSIPIA